MTLQELYTLIGGNYDQATKILRREKLIDRYIRKFSTSQVGDALAAAGESMDAAALFESAHAMKGVCANLGLDTLAERASEVAEEFRPGANRQFTDDEVRGKIAAINQLYQRTLVGIQQYENG
jgi:HPt (histidine-containing phosphotransfer) domain-containing protein